VWLPVLLLVPIKQPWRFVAISAPEMKREIRLAAEKEERQNYEGRFPQEWLDVLAPLETDWHKGIPRDCAVTDRSLPY
jgi:hypothetical protein